MPNFNRMTFHYLGRSEPARARNLRIDPPPQTEPLFDRNGIQVGVRMLATVPEDRDSRFRPPFAQPAS
jgi:hypothetical protein